MKIFRDRAGATAIEYSLLAAVIAIVSIGAMQYTGDMINEVRDCATSSLEPTDNCPRRAQIEARLFFDQFYEDTKLKNREGYDPTDGVNDDYEIRCAECNGYGGAGHMVNQAVYEAAAAAISEHNPELAAAFKADPNYMKQEMSKLRAKAYKALREKFGDPVDGKEQWKHNDPEAIATAKAAVTAAVKAW